MNITKQIGPNVTRALAMLKEVQEVRKSNVNLIFSGNNATVKPLTGAEDMKLMSLRSSTEKFINEFNKVIFEHSEFEKPYKSVEEMCANLPAQDKALLVWGLLDSTFEELPKRQITCTACEAEFSPELSPSMMLHDDSEGEPWVNDVSRMDFILKKEFINGALEVYFKFPTVEKQTKLAIETEKAIQRKKAISTGQALSAYVIKLVMKDAADPNNVVELVDSGEIIMFLDNLPLDTLDKFAAVVEDELLKYNVKFYIDMVCPSCGHTWKWEGVDPENEFFRKAFYTA